MADFTLSQIGEVAPSGPRPQQAVQEPSAVAAGLDFASGVVGSLFESTQANQEAQAEVQANEAVSRFSRQQVQIADAVDRGDLTSQEARMRMRANWSAAISDNPGLTEALSQAHTSIIGTAGLGKVAAEGTEQEQAFFKAQDNATQDGWVTPNMTQDEAMEATYAYIQFNREQQRIEAEQNVLSLKRAQVGLQRDRVSLGTARINQQSANLNLQNQRAERASQTSAGAMADAYSTRLRTKWDTLLRDVDAGNIDPVEAARIVDDEWMQVQSSVAQMGRDAGGDYVSNLVSPMRDFYELTRQRITGEVDTAVYESLSQNALARQAANIAGDPDNARILATSKMVGQGGNLALQGPLTQVAMGAVGRNSSETGRPADLTDPDTAEGSRQYLQLLRDSVSKSNSGSFIGDTEGAEAEVRTNINQVLRGLGSYGNMVDNPQQLNDVVDFLSSDTYGQYVESNGTAINQENVQAASQVIENQFASVVRPLIVEEWRNADVGDIGARPGPSQEEAAGSTVRPVFTGAGVRFQATEDTASVPGLGRKVEDLNRRVAPVMNRLIRLGAHMQGHRNYQQVYESNYAQLFGDAGTGAGVNE